MAGRPRARLGLTVIGVVALVVATANPAAAPPGDLDHTFDGDGKATTHFWTAHDRANAVAIQADGKIVAAGCSVHCPPDGPPSPGTFALARYNPDGTLDPTFGGDGKVTTDIAGGDDEALAVAIQADGRIVAAGRVGNSFSHDFALARYNPDGTLDSTFGGDGTVTTSFADIDQAYGVAIQADGKIVAAGHQVLLPSDPDTKGTIDFAVARYNPDGSLDPLFSTDGRVTTDFGGRDEASGIAIQTDGKIVAAGWTAANLTGPSDFAVARYNPDGSLDPLFSTDGRVTTDVGGSDQALAVAIQPFFGTDAIVVAGVALVAGSFDFALARYNTIGVLDPFFDLDGVVTTDFAGGDQADAVAIQADGKIVATGCSNCPSGDFALARYNTDGTLDPTFNGDGKVTTDFGGDDDHAFGVAVQGDGKIVTAGVAGPSPTDFALARYNPAGTRDPTFGGDGTVTTDFPGTSDQATAVAIQADGKIVAAGQGMSQSFEPLFGVVRYHPNGSVDRVITTDFPGPSEATAVAIQADGKIVAAGVVAAPGFSGTVDFAVARYNPDGTLDPTFGGDGMVTTDFAQSRDFLRGVAIQADGKIVAAGSSAPNFFSPSDFAMARYNPDGALDPTFGGDGKVTSDLMGSVDEAYGVVIQTDGKIVAAGFAVTLGLLRVGFALARYNPDGSLDPTFGGDGKVTTDFPAGHGRAYGVALQPDGNIVAVGSASPVRTADDPELRIEFALARYVPNGSLDATFGGDGTVTTDFPGNLEEARGVATQANGKIVVAGLAVPSTSDFAVARYSPDGSLDPTFSGDGKVTTDFAGDLDEAGGVAIQADGKIVAAGLAVDSGDRAFAVARYSGCRRTSRPASVRFCA